MPHYCEERGQGLHSQTIFVTLPICQFLGALQQEYHLWIKKVI